MSDLREKVEALLAEIDAVGSPALGTVEAVRTALAAGDTACCGSCPRASFEERQAEREAIAGAIEQWSDDPFGVGVRLSVIIERIRGGEFAEKARGEGGGLPPRCDRCGRGHDIGNPCVRPEPQGGGDHD